MLNENKSGFDKNALIGMLLIGAILIWFQYTAPKEESQDSQTTTEEISATSSSDQTSSGSSSLENIPSIVDTAIAQSQGPNTLHFLENDHIKLGIQNIGGKIVYAEQVQYKTWEKKPLVQVVEQNNTFGWHLPDGNDRIHTDQAYFDLVKKGDNFLSLIHTTNTGKQIEYTYTLDQFGIDLKVTTKGFQNEFTGNRAPQVSWKLDIPRQEKSLSNEKAKTTIYYHDTEEVESLSESSDDSEDAEKVEWIALKDQFFSNILRVPSTLENAQMKVVNFAEGEENFVKTLSFTASHPTNGELNTSLEFRFFPNHFKTLKDYEHDYELVIPLGWGFLGWINRYLVIELFHFLESMNLGYGLIIFIMAVLIKLLLFPLTKKSYTSSAAMKVLKPQIEELQKKHKDDPMALQKEQMALYGKAGVSPLSGCLPLLAQMPILFALFQFFPASIELRQEGFLWATDLSTYDNIYNLGFHIPAYGSHISLFALLMAGSSFLQMTVNNQNTSMGNNDQAKMMKYMMYFMPIIFLTFMNGYPAALSYYYLIANLMTFGQQWFIRRNIDEDALLAKIESNKKKNENKGGNRFQRKMEELMKAQETQNKK